MIAAACLCLAQRHGLRQTCCLQGHRIFLARIMDCKTKEDAIPYNGLRLLMLRAEMGGEPEDEGFPAEELVGMKVSSADCSCHTSLFRHVVQLLSAC